MASEIIHNIHFFKRLSDTKRFCIKVDCCQGPNKKCRLFQSYSWGFVSIQQLSSHGFILVERIHQSAPIQRSTISY